MTIFALHSPFLLLGKKRKTNVLVKSHAFLLDLIEFYRRKFNNNKISNFCLYFRVPTDIRETLHKIFVSTYSYFNRNIRLSYIDRPSDASIKE